jgi:hypothetical protein
MDHTKQPDVAMEDALIRADWGKLTPNQQILIQLYLKTGKKLASYREVYHGPNSGSKANASTIERNCYKEFAKPHIAAVVRQIQQAAVRDTRLTLAQIRDAAVDDIIQEQTRIDELKIDSQWVLRRVALLADFNINKFLIVDVGGQAYYDFSLATDDDWYCISEYTTEEISRGTQDNLVLADKIKIKAYDKLRALELVGKHVSIGAFRDRIELGGDPENPIKTITRRIIKATDEEGE